ncbi:protein saal1 isoform X1 [Periophthalmus magnuspinnatus]|uniref:protein saal1 isoform X1 n=1 Tax=Periophthalmus magnuspinnatus TaxID=409849 RepID=UPI00145BF5AE|nr:protein saal1 isoform X1 [Periophthalmus magnuspinnatus]
MDCNPGVVDAGGDNSSSPEGSESPELDRNPSPPPANEEAGEDADAIGDTVYSKHWLFSTLTRLIQMITKHAEEASEGPMDLSNDDEEDLCKLWDMAMDKDVAGFLQEFRATDILLGVIAKSRCPRLTEICVGILGNIACFPETCLTLSQNEELGEVLLLLLGDTDPPTLLETCRLLLTCVSQKDVCSLWLERMQQQPSVCSNLCFIMRSSTNTDLLEKVGELVDKAFDLDEGLMRSWVTPKSHPEAGNGESCVDVASCLLEAGKQLRSESPNGLEIYLHILQLLTTITEGIQIFCAADGPGKAIWNFLCEVVCEGLCQTDDLPVVLQEQRGILVQAFAVLQALYKCQDQWSSKGDTSLTLIGRVLQVLHFHSEYKNTCTEEEYFKNEQLQTLAEISAEFLADISPDISKELMAKLIKEGYLTEKTCLAAAESLYTSFATSFQHLSLMLSEVDPGLSGKLKKHFPV